MTETATLDTLKHVGVKGMKWGVRRDLAKLNTHSARQKYLDSIDQKWVDKVNSNPKVARITRRTASRMRKINKDVKAEYRAEYGRVSMNTNPRLRSKYQARMKEEYETALYQEIYRAHKISPSRTKEVQFENRPGGEIRLKVVTRTNAKLDRQNYKIEKTVQKRQAKERKSVKQSAITHTDLPDPTDEDFEGMEFVIVQDSDGFYDDVVSVTDVGLADVTVSEVEHAGVKGMKWGVRRPVGKDGRVVRTGVAPGTKTTLAKKSSAPAKKTAPAKKPASSSTTSKPKPLTDEQLRQRVQRMQLEAQYAQLSQQLNPPQKSFLREYLAEPARNAAKEVSKELAKEIIKVGISSATKGKVNLSKKK